jgi:hypothetical protein
MACYRDIFTVYSFTVRRCISFSAVSLPVEEDSLPPTPSLETNEVTKDLGYVR